MVNNDRLLPMHDGTLVVPYARHPVFAEGTTEAAGKERWVMLYNDRGSVPYGHADYNLRTPLSVAVSDDYGRHWSKLGNLEDESRNYCCFSLLFDGDRFLATYYQSGTAVDAEGIERRINLASLKVCGGPTEIFLGG